MRLAKVTCIGPGGASLVVDATGENGLEVRGDESNSVAYILDGDLPPFTENPTAPYPRVMAVIPTSWALAYEWEHTAPLPRVPE